MIFKLFTPIVRYTLLSSLAPSMNTNIQRRRSFSFFRFLSYCPRLISPISWWHCFILLYNPIAFEHQSWKNILKSLCQITLKKFQYILIHLILLLLIGIWCYLYWTITFDAGQYLTLLSDISSNKTNISDGRTRFDGFFWRTALKTVFISIDFGLINALATMLAAYWRQRLCKQFYRMIFSSSPNGCILYETAQKSTYDLPTQLTNDIRQFTSHLSISLFGSLFFSGLLAVSTIVIVFSVYIVQKTNGDRNGILICFGTFVCCVLIVMIMGYKFNRTAVEQLKAKGKIRSFLQRLQTSAECVSLYASTRRCELISYLKLNKFVHRWNIRAGIWYALVNIPLIFMGAIGDFMTYILPALLFFFLRQSENQTPNDAKKYLSIIAFYGYVFWLLSSLIWISESCLIALTLADRLMKLRKRLIDLREYHRHRLQYDQTNDLIEISKLRIIVPDDEYEQYVLQSDVNLRAQRGECVLINGETGSGKTSLFRICAGLWPINAEIVRLPARKQTIYIPQRPYLPIGSLRFQSLFLVDLRCGQDQLINITDQQIRELFQLVNMNYLLDRYDLDTIVDWSTYLSIGEQQRLAFVRLFALFKYHPNQIETTLVMFDESTSAVDAQTESRIYELLNNLHIWFVTISHRPLLIKYHKKQLKLHSRYSGEQQYYEESISTMDTLIKMPTDDPSPSIDTIGEDEIVNTVVNNHSTGYIEENETKSWFRELISIWKLIHLPFQSDDRTSRIQTHLVWFLCFATLGAYTYLSYRVTVQTGAIFTILPSYAASSIDIDQGRQKIIDLIWPYISQIVGLVILYSAQLGFGQTLAALYTRRQSIAIARLLLDDDDNQYTLYHTSTLKLLPNIISHDLADFNVQLFYLLIGSIYYNGIIGVLVKCIPYTLLLVQQSGSFKGVLIVYCYQLFISLLILCVIRPYYHANMKFENSFALFTNAQKRIDLQAEQIALSDQTIIDIEHKQLKSKLDTSIREQNRSGFFYGLLVACSVLGNWSSTIINYGIPSLIFFHFTSYPMIEQAAKIITLTVYTGYAQSNLAVFNSHGQPYSQIWTIGKRIVQNLEQLIRQRQSHRYQRIEEFASQKRIESDTSSIIFTNVNITIPDSSSTILIHSLNLSLHAPSSLIITGSSGCGKSSLLRLIAGLYYNHTEYSILSLPIRSSMIFIPQQLYLIEGTLLEQLNYFRHAKNMSTFTNDQQIKELLSKFNLLHLIDRYSLDSSVHLWSRTLSLGEQQRLIIVVALLTLFQPFNSNQQIKYFILDETTAGCDELTEKIIYEYLQNSHIQYISISHRNQLIKYHTHQLIIDSKTKSYKLIKLS